MNNTEEHFEEMNETKQQSEKVEVHQEAMRRLGDIAECRLQAADNQRKDEDEDFGDVCEEELNCKDCQHGGHHFHCEASLPVILTGGLL